MKSIVNEINSHTSGVRTGLRDGSWYCDERNALTAYRYYNLISFIMWLISINIMKISSWLEFVIRFLGMIILAEVVVLSIVFLIGWRMGWNTVDQYREAIQIAGLLAIGFGFFGVKGNWDATRSFSYQYSMSTSNQNSWERTQQTLLDFAQAFKFLILMFIVGGINIILGWII